MTMQADFMFNVVWVCVKLFYQKSDFSPAGIFGPGGISDSVIIAYLELFSLKEYVNQISRTVKSVHS